MMSEPDPSVSDQGPARRPPSVWQVIKSTIAAAFGVQTEEARQRDFSQGNASTFIIAGFVFTAVFVALLVLIVSLVLSQVA